SAAPTLPASPTLAPTASSPTVPPTPAATAIPTSAPTATASPTLAPTANAASATATSVPTTYHMVIPQQTDPAINEANGPHIAAAPSCANSQRDGAAAMCGPFASLIAG